jgi:hypothetical protein
LSKFFIKIFLGERKFMVESIIKWRPLIIGIAIILAIYLLLATAVQGGENALFGFLLGGIALGYLTNAKIRNVLINGVILALITGLVTLVILFIQIATNGLLSSYTTSGLIEALLTLLAYDIIAVLVGVVIGNVSRFEYLKSIKS